MQFFQVQVKIYHPKCYSKYNHYHGALSTCSMIEMSNYLIDLGRTFDIDSLSMLLITKSLFRKDSVPLDTLTGIRTRSAIIVIGTKIFRLQEW